MASDRNLSSGWTTYEVILSDGRGGYGPTPFSDTLAASPDRLAQVINKLRIIEAIGWPEAKRRLVDDNGHPLIVKKDDVIWLLKCKPTCWRLYFYVVESKKYKRIVYVHAVCKKQDKEDAREAVEARRVAGTIRPGGSGITPFPFPDR